MTQARLRLFQSRNRVSSLFKSVVTTRNRFHRLPFQSRNRVSSLFKSTQCFWPHQKRVSFNLVIEYLLFSSSRLRSRSRSLYSGSFSFNLGIEYLLFSSKGLSAGMDSADRFNLGIEYLLFSSESCKSIWSSSNPCFNLVIEYLLFSSAEGVVFESFDRELVSISESSIFSFQVSVSLFLSRLTISMEFQSRNRVSSLFKSDTQPVSETPSRGSFNLVIEYLLFSSGHLSMPASKR